MKIINKNSWIRKEYFELFSNYDEPFFGLVSDIDCTSLYNKVKKTNESFFAHYLHKSLKVVNEINEFKYRIVDQNVVLYDNIHASAVIGRENGTFGFTFVEFNKDFEIFNKNLQKEIKSVQSSIGLRLNKETKRNDVIHYSSIPWSKFSGLSHARNFKYKDSEPKITFGKIFTIENKMLMPVSVNVHHGLVDGIHVSKFLNLFQDLLDK